MNNNIYGIDLGTCNFKVFCKASGKIFSEKNTIAVINKNQIYAYGDDAYAMYEKAPETIHVSFPVSTGVIADYNFLQTMMLDYLETKLKCKTDAVGLGIDVNEPTGVMVVDMGADTIEISVISLGGLVLSDLMHFGSNRLDESIISHIRREFNLVIGKKTAKSLKEELGCGLPGRNEKMTIVGLDVVSGLPVEREISAEIVYEAIKANLESICTSIKMILEKTPPELAKDIIHAGIYITGGGSKIMDLDKLFTKITNIKVNTCENPEESAVLGLSMIATDSKYQRLPFTVKSSTLK